jgi:hypothetical protein
MAIFIMDAFLALSQQNEIDFIIMIIAKKSRFSRLFDKFVNRVSYMVVIFMFSRNIHEISPFLAIIIINLYFESADTNIIP